MIHYLKNDIDRFMYNKQKTVESTIIALTDN